MRLFESIVVALSPSKRSYVEKPCVALMSDTPPAPMPSTNVAGPSYVSVARPLAWKDACPNRDGVSTGSTLIDNLEDEKVVLVPPRAPSWEEIMELLKQVPCFTETKPPSTKMSDFVPLTKRVLVDINNNFPISIAARLPYRTLESVVSRIQPMQDYTTHEMVEVVSSVPL